MTYYLAPFIALAAYAFGGALFVGALYALDLVTSGAVSRLVERLGLGDKPEYRR